MTPSQTISVLRRSASRPGSLADLAELRATSYGLLGSLFLYPAPDDLAELAVAARSFPPKGHLAHEFPFFPSLRVLLDRVRDLGQSEREQIEHEYVELFVVGCSQPPCPPYESAYAERAGAERGLVSIAVERAYARSGVNLLDQSELPDHAALELAFLSVLCDEEREAWREDEVDRAHACLRREQQFLERHLGRWLPSFACRLACAAAPAGLYRALADASHAFIVHDRGLVRALLEQASLAGARLEGAQA